MSLDDVTWMFIKVLFGFQAAASDKDPGTRMGETSSRGEKVSAPNRPKKPTSATLKQRMRSFF